MKHHGMRKGAHGLDVISYFGCVADDEDGVAVAGVEVGAGVEVRVAGEGAEWGVELELAVVLGLVVGVVGSHVDFSNVETGEVIWLGVLFYVTVIPVLILDLG